MRKLTERIADSLAGDFAIAATTSERRIVRHVSYSIADCLASEYVDFDREAFYRIIGLSEPFNDGTMEYRRVRE